MYRYPPPPPKRELSGLVTAAIVIAIIVAVLLGVRAFLIVRGPGGMCVIETQPSVLIGASPSLVTALNCG